VVRWGIYGPSNRHKSRTRNGGAATQLAAARIGKKLWGFLCIIRTQQKGAHPIFANVFQMIEKGFLAQTRKIQRSGTRSSSGFVAGTYGKLKSGIKNQRRGSGNKGRQRAPVITRNELGHDEKPNRDPKEGSGGPKTLKHKSSEPRRKSRTDKSFPKKVKGWPQKAGVISTVENVLTNPARLLKHYKPSTLEGYALNRPGKKSSCTSSPLTKNKNGT